MHRILTFFLGLYWLVQFALQSIALQGGAHPATGGGQPLSMVLAFATWLVAVLFLWLLVTVLLTDDPAENQVEEVARLAFPAATGVLTVCLVAGAGDPAIAFSSAIPLQLAALLASYVAVFFERRIGTHAGPSPDDDPAAAARAMALTAAHNSLLSLISGRPGPGEAR